MELSKITLNLNPHGTPSRFEATPLLLILLCKSIILHVPCVDGTQDPLDGMHSIQGENSVFTKMVEIPFA